MSSSWRLLRVVLWLTIVLLHPPRTTQQPNTETIWKQGDLQELQDLLKCDQDRPLPIHAAETWKQLQSVYESIVQDQSSLPKGGFLGIDGFYVPYMVDYSEHGRGIFATEPISEGTLVWKSIQTARFRTGKEYRTYLQQLTPALGCDVLSWAYTRLEQRTYVACVDLDPGSFMNGCDTEDDCNLDVSSPRHSGCNLEFYAIRDIEEGEEFRIDYTFSERLTGWMALGMWRETSNRHEYVDDQQEDDEGDDEEKGDNDEEVEESWPDPPNEEL